MTEKLIVSWEDYNQTVEKLALMVHESGYRDSKIGDCCQEEAREDERRSFWETEGSWEQYLGKLWYEYG